MYMKKQLALVTLIKMAICILSLVCIFMNIFTPITMLCRIFVFFATSLLFWYNLIWLIMLIFDEEIDWIPNIVFTSDGVVWLIVAIALYFWQNLIIIKLPTIYSNSNVMEFTLIWVIFILCWLDIGFTIGFFYCCGGSTELGQRIQDKLDVLNDVYNKLPLKK